MDYVEFKIGRLNMRASRGSIRMHDGAVHDYDRRHEASFDLAFRAAVYTYTCMRYPKKRDIRSCASS